MSTLSTEAASQLTYNVSRQRPSNPYVGLAEHATLSSHFGKAAKGRDARLAFLKSGTQPAWAKLQMDLPKLGYMSLDDNRARSGNKPRSVGLNGVSIFPADHIRPETYAAIEISKQAVKAKRAHSRRNPKQAHPARRPDSPAPAYQPLPIRPIGSSRILGARAGQEFVPYQPVRFTAPELSQSSRGQTPAKPIPNGLPAEQPKGRRVGSPPRSQPSYAPQESVIKVSSPAPTRSVTQVRQPLRFSALRLPPPDPTADYLAQSFFGPKKLSSPQSLLVVLDLNGTLLARSRGRTTITERPYLDRFVEYCLKHHSVMIWSSAQPGSVAQMCGKIFKPQQRKKLVREWGRDTLELTNKDYYNKVQVYKRLDRIWEDTMLQSKHPCWEKFGKFSQKNTVLIDDSRLKAQKQPFNHIEIPEYTTRSGDEGTGMEVLGQVVGYLEELRKWDDVSRFIRANRFEIDRGWSWDWEEWSTVS
ncbi:MAG: hypothetical protein Q9187_000144 [Circinaria calcarea]